MQTMDAVPVPEEQSRTARVLGADAVAKLAQAHVAVFGVGGVGGHLCEALARSGVGALTVIDNDRVSLSNINRQAVAFHSTVGRLKVEVMRDMIRDINPDCRVDAIQEFIRDDRMVDLLEADRYDCVVDCIDTLAPKVFLLYHSHRLGYPTVSSMGSGGKLDPSQVHSCDIAQSNTCPLAAMVRKRLHHLGVYSGIRVVFSTEKIPPHAMFEDRSDNHLTTIGTISYMPPLFGCFMAAEVVQILLANNKDTNL